MDGNEECIGRAPVGLEEGLISPRDAELLEVANEAVEISVRHVLCSDVRAGKGKSVSTCLQECAIWQRALRRKAKVCNDVRQRPLSDITLDLLIARSCG